MKKFFVNFVDYFIPKTHSKSTQQNTIPGLNIIDTGQNNHIILAPDLSKYKFNNCKFIIQGDNCTIEILPTNQTINDLFIIFNQNVNNATVSIGKNFGCQSTKIFLNDSNNRIIIGDNCMFSWDIQLISSDGHPIYDKDTMCLLNTSKDIIIGDHCWIGTGCTILKNVTLGNNVICGAKSVITKPVNENNIIIVGTPARIVKRNVCWDGAPPSLFITKKHNG